VAAEAAIAALEDTSNVQINIQRNSDARQEFFNSAYGRMMRPVDSYTNFIFFKTSRRVDDMVGHFKNHNVLIGPHYPGFDDYIRVSIGLPEEMHEFWRVWSLMPLSNEMTM
jgi:histidinol-phosphate/aromatic aminotransferase/cobyric acid decarboxylase-like protein